MSGKITGGCNTTPFGGRGLMGLYSPMITLLSDHLRVMDSHNLILIMFATCVLTCASFSETSLDRQEGNVDKQAERTQALREEQKREEWTAWDSAPELKQLRKREEWTAWASTPVLKDVRAREE